jgi:hypothetical protein
MRIKDTLDWLQRGVALWQILVALGLGESVNAILRGATHLPSSVITPIWLFVSAAILWILPRIVSRRAQPQPQGVSSGAALQVGQVGLDTRVEQFIKGGEEIYKKNTGAMVQEVESLIQRVMASFNNSKDRDGFLIRFISGGLLVVLHDYTWNTIYLSQLNLLQELNTKPAMILTDIKPFYDAAVAAYPDRYKDYSFEQWLAYMRGQNIILQDGSVVQITVRGKDFLRYIVQEGHSLKIKSM